MIDGPGIAIHVHGDGARFIADVRSAPGDGAQAMTALPLIRSIRSLRAVSRSLRKANLRVDVRVARRTVFRLG